MLIALLAESRFCSDQRTCCLISLVSLGASGTTLRVRVTADIRRVGGLVCCPGLAHGQSPACRRRASDRHLVAFTDSLAEDRVQDSEAVPDRIEIAGAVNAVVLEARHLGDIDRWWKDAVSRSRSRPHSQTLG